MILWRPSVGSGCLGGAGSGADRAAPSGLSFSLSHSSSLLLVRFCVTWEVRPEWPSGGADTDKVLVARSWQVRGAIELASRRAVLGIAVGVGGLECCCGGRAGSAGAGGV